MKAERFFHRSISQAHERGERPIFAPTLLRQAEAPAIDQDLPALTGSAAQMVRQLLEELEWLAPRRWHCCAHF